MQATYRDFVTVDGVAAAACARPLAAALAALRGVVRGEAREPSEDLGVESPDASHCGHRKSRGTTAVRNVVTAASPK